MPMRPAGERSPKRRDQAAVFCGWRGGGRSRGHKIRGAALGAIENEFDRGNLDPVAAGVLGAIERVIGLREQRREVENGVMAYHDADAHRRGHRPAFDIARSGGKARADVLADRHGALASRIEQEGCEFLVAEAEEIHAAHAATRLLGENFQHAIADRMTEAVVDRFEVVEVERHHRNRPRISRLPLELGFAVLQEGAAVGDTGERIDERGVLWRYSVRSSPWRAG